MVELKLPEIQKGRATVITQAKNLWVDECSSSKKREKMDWTEFMRLEAHAERLCLQCESKAVQHKWC